MLSYTGSSDVECARSWLKRGILVWEEQEDADPAPVVVVCLFVKVREMAVLGRAGLAGWLSLTLMLRCNVILPGPKTLPSPISRSSKKSSRSASACEGFLDGAAVGAGVAVFGDGGDSSGIRSGEKLFLRCWRRSMKLKGPGGRISPSKVSSSLSAVMELEMLGLRADAEELRAERPSRRVPPYRVPRLPSPQSGSSRLDEHDDGVLGMSLLVDNRSLPSEGSSRSSSKSSSGSLAFSDFCGVGGVMKETGCGGILPLETLMVADPSPKKSSSSSVSLNLSRLRAEESALAFDCVACPHCGGWADELPLTWRRVSGNSTSVLGLTLNACEASGSSRSVSQSS